MVRTGNYYGDEYILKRSKVTVLIDLVKPYNVSKFDPINATDLLHDEVQQRRETLYDVDSVVERANVTDPTDRLSVLALVDELSNAERLPGWTYEEPNGLKDISECLPKQSGPTAHDPKTFNDKIQAAWLGRIAGCNVGKPVELGWYWTVDHIRDYLQRAGAYPLRDYFPLLDPMPPEFKFRESWRYTTIGLVDGSARDDDIDYAILALHMLEKWGKHLHPANVADEWTALLPLRQTFTAERAAYINLSNGMSHSEAATFRNPYREWIGAQIRGDVYGYILPGQPWEAAALSFRDASLSHVGNGVYAEMWAAALVSSAFVCGSVAEIIEMSMSVVPPRSRLAEAINDVRGMYDEGMSWEHAIERIQATYGHYSWVHTVNNAAVLVAGLLWGEGDYMATIGYTVMGGWDTDSNGATAGSVVGIFVGTAGLPGQLIDPLHNRTRSAMFGFDNSLISDLAHRTFVLANSDLNGSLFEPPDQPL